MPATSSFHSSGRESRSIRSVLNRRWGRCLAVTIVFGLLILPVPIPFRVILLACLASIWTWAEAGNLKPLGFSRHRLSSTLIWSFGIFVVMIVFGSVLLPLIQQVLGMRSDLSAYGALEGNAPAALKLLGMALTSAAFGEEILFRGFLLHQLTAILGAGDAARRTAIATSGITFGLAHFNQGPFGIATTGIVGLAFAWVWFRTGRNLWALILAHALVDTYGIALLYLGFYA